MLDEKTLAAMQAALREKQQPVKIIEETYKEPNPCQKCGRRPPHCKYCGRFNVISVRRSDILVTEERDGQQKRTRYNGFRCRVCGNEFSSRDECNAPRMKLSMAQQTEEKKLRDDALWHKLYDQFAGDKEERRAAAAAYAMFQAGTRVEPNSKYGRLLAKVLAARDADAPTQPDEAKLPPDDSDEVSQILRSLDTTNTKKENNTQ